MPVSVVKLAWKRFRLYGTLRIINTNQGSQLQSGAFITAVATSGEKLNMRGKRAGAGNIIINSFFRSL